MSTIENIQAVIDIGSSRLRVLIAQSNTEGKFSVLGCGVVNAEAVKAGVIKDIAAAKQALHYAIEEAERQSGYEIRNVDVAIGGEYVMGLNSEAQIFVSNQQVSNAHMRELVLQARHKVSEPSQQILHILAQQYVLDGRYEVAYPESMPARQVNASYHVLRADQTMCATIKRCVEAAGVGVNAIVSSALASSYMATTAEEREMGVCLLDIGAGTSDFMIWLNGVPIASGGLTIGGEQVSSHLAGKYSTTRQYAEMLKCQQGAMLLPLMKTQFLELPHTGLRSGRKIESADFVAAIHESYAQLFQHFEAALRRLGMREIPIHSIVITGGAAQLPGLTHYLEEKFALPARLAKPYFIEGLADHLQYDAGMTGVLGIAKLLYEPLPDHVWEIQPKRDIIRKLKHIFGRGSQWA